MVLVILGLLLGAVLKRQELIASAQVNTLISSMNGYRAAINGFQDRYRIASGDSSAAATKVGNGAVNCTLYCDDGAINYMVNASLVNNHLSVAGFYSGPAGTVESNDGPSTAKFLSNPGWGDRFLWPTWGMSTGATTATPMRRIYPGGCKRAGGFPPSCWAKWTGGLTTTTEMRVGCGFPRNRGKRKALLAVGTKLLIVVGLRTTPVQTAVQRNCWTDHSVICPA